jgi:hypothetical protein
MRQPNQGNNNFFVSQQQNLIQNVNQNFMQNPSNVRPRDFIQGQA